MVVLLTGDVNVIVLPAGRLMTERPAGSGRGVVGGVDGVAQCDIAAQPRDGDACRIVHAAAGIVDVDDARQHQPSLEQFQRPPHSLRARLSSARVRCSRQIATEPACLGLT